MTYVVADFGGRQERVRLGARLAAGGAGEILLVAHHPEYVAKLYLTAQDRQQYEQKIEDMIRRPPNLPPIRQNNTEYVQIAWPTATLRDTAGRFLGFLMPAVDLKAATELENALQRTGRQARNIPEFYGGRVLLAANLAALVAELHSLGHYFTDMKPVNLRFYPQSWYLAVLDTDGMSIAGMKRWPAHQFSDEYIAPEARGQSPEALGIEQDLFALAVIIFRLLNNGIHPYQGIDFGGANPTSLQERINAGLYAYGLQPSRQVGPALASIHEFLEDTTRQLFDRAFLGNYRSRPSALEWKTHLQSLITGKAVIRCAVNPADHAHFSKGCGLCELDRKRAGATTATPAGGRRARQQPPTPTQLTPTVQWPLGPLGTNTPATPGRQATSARKKWLYVAVAAFFIFAVWRGNRSEPPVLQEPTQSAATPESRALSEPSTVICKSALSDAKGSWESTAQTSVWIIEAKRRGFDRASCTSLLDSGDKQNDHSGRIATPSNASPAPQWMRDAQITDVCRFSLRPDGQGWGNGDPSFRWIQEAERRGVDLDACRRIWKSAQTKDQAAQIEAQRRADEQKRLEQDRTDDLEAVKREAFRRQQEQEAARAAQASGNGARIGPSFDCSSMAVSRQKLAQMICANNTLAWMDLKYVNAYQALRAATAVDRRQNLVDEADAFVRSITDRCDILSAQDVQRPTETQLSCIVGFYQSKIDSIYARLPSAAQAELKLRPDQILEVQRLLADQGLQSQLGAIDGVIGPATRAAIAEWERQAGLQVSGYASASLLTQLEEAQKSRQISAESSGPHGSTQLTFCNQTRDYVSVAIAGQRGPEDPEFRVEGWWIVEPSQCSAIGSWAQGAVYWFAKSDNQQWVGSFPYCVGSSNFLRINRPNYYCSAEETLEKFSPVTLDGPTRTLEIW